MTRRNPSRGRRTQERQAKRAELNERLGRRTPRPQPQNPAPKRDEKREDER